MAESNSLPLPRLSAEQRFAAAKQFERANQVIAAGDLDYAVQLLLNCCGIDPGNPTYRQALRQTQKLRYRNNGRGQPLAFLRTLPAKWRLRQALRRGEPIAALEHGERALLRNPWDRGTHLRMAEAFDALGLLNLAVWTLEQVRGQYPQDPAVNRPLARLYEKRGNFTQAIALWELVRKAMPHDLEAQRKAKDLAASATIARGRYEEAISGDAPTPLVGATQETDVEHRAADATAPSQPALPAAPAVPREQASLEAQVKANPTIPSAYLALAGYHRRNERLDRARETLRQGLAATGNHFEVALELLDLDIEPFRRDLALA